MTGTAEGSIYLIGSLRNPEVPRVANQLRAEGFDVFSSWYCASENADDRWQEHEQGRGLTYREAIADYAAQNILAFDTTHLKRCQVGVLVTPAGKSTHVELGYLLGQGKPAFILLDKEPEGRWDVMLGLSTKIVMSLQELMEELGNVLPPQHRTGSALK